MKQTLKTLEGMTAGDLEAKANRGNKGKKSIQHSGNETNNRTLDIELIHEIFEMPKEKSLTIKAGELSRIFNSFTSFTHSAAIEEILHFYKMFFPDDSRTIFRLAMTAGYILDSGSVREHLREVKTK